MDEWTERKLTVAIEDAKSVIAGASEFDRDCHGDRDRRIGCLSYGLERLVRDLEYIVSEAKACSK